MADDFEALGKLGSGSFGTVFKVRRKTDGQTYVINKHSASKKIWFSSPITGANYFSYNFENKKWLDDKGKELTELLLLELTTNFNFKL